MTMTNERCRAERAALRYVDRELGFEHARVMGFLPDPSIEGVSLVLVRYEDGSDTPEIALLVRETDVVAEHDAEDFFRNGGRRIDGSYTNGTRTYGGPSIWGAR